MGTTARPRCIVAGPDNALWFTDAASNVIGRISTTGTLTTFPIPTASAGAGGITLGPAGALWFSESAKKIGRITTGGAITEYSVASTNIVPNGITTGCDGNIVASAPAAQC